MKLGIKGNAFVVFACAAMAFVSVTRAQTTNYLGDLRAEVEARADDTNTTRVQKAALKAAGNVLKRPAKTFAAQLGQLATAATVLNKRFTNDTELSLAEEAALQAYFDEAEVQFAEAELRLETNSIPRGVSNQLAKAWTAVTNAAANTNGVPERARLLAKAFNKMRIPLSWIARKYPLPTVPPVTAEAPVAIEFGKSFRLEQNADHAPILMDLWTFAGNENGGTPYLYNHYHISNLPPDGEIGTWSYQKTGAQTGIINIDADYPANAANRTIFLNFTSATSGTFNTTIVHGDVSTPVSGQMSVITNFVPAP
jgi:hypothetical protein